MHPSLSALVSSGAEQTMLQASGNSDAPRAVITGLGTEQSPESPRFELNPESTADSVLTWPVDVPLRVGQILPPGGKPLPPPALDGGAIPDAAIAVADHVEVLPVNPAQITTVIPTTPVPPATPVPAATPVATATPVPAATAPDAKAQQDLLVHAAEQSKMIKPDNPAPLSRRALSQGVPARRNVAVSPAESPGRNVRDTSPAREDLLTTAMNQPKTTAAKPLPPIDALRPWQRPDARAAGAESRVARPERQPDKIPAALAAAASARAVPVLQPNISREAPLVAAPSLIGVGQKQLGQANDADPPGAKFDLKPGPAVRPADSMPVHRRSVQGDVVTTVTTPLVRPLQSDVARQTIAEAITTTVPVESSAAQPASTSVLPVVQATSDLLSIRTAVPAYAESAPSPVATIARPVADAAWAEALGERVASMANGNVRALEIRLNPAELGPLQVHIAMDDKQIEVTFNVSNALTREAIENSLPRLKDMLAEGGMSLAGASVDDQDGANRAAGGHRAADGGQKKASHIEIHDVDGAPESQELPPEPATARGPKGLVDTFA